MRQRLSLWLVMVAAGWANACALKEQHSIVLDWGKTCPQECSHAGLVMLWFGFIVAGLVLVFWEIDENGFFR